MQIDEVAQILKESHSGLQGEIVRDIGLFTVGLLRVSQTATGERLDLCGTGTLVSFAGDHYILTAAHVWEELSNSNPPASVGLTLREHLHHKYVIDRATIVAIGSAHPAQWNEWGPDLIFLRVPPEHVGAINVYKAFWSLLRLWTAGIDVTCIDLRVLMGTPSELAECTDTNAELQITGMLSAPSRERYSSLQATQDIRSHYDYIDLDMDLALVGVPQAFGGVSGGGLWRVFVYWSDSTSKIEWKKDIEGVAFYQTDIVNNHRVIRCHGPQSIGVGVRLLA